MKTIDKILKVQADFKELYDKNEVLAVSSDYIQLEIKTFLETFDGFEVLSRECDTYPYKFHATHEGMSFIAVADKEELEKYKGGK